MIKVLFVCTGNIFRSMVAEKCLKNYLIKNDVKNIKVDSAGTNSLPEEIKQSQKITNLIKKKLNLHHIEFNHQYKKVSQKLIDGADIIIAMNVNH
ncbi:MAG: low molecular weight phosphatase family protein [Nanoarchaeota archaeon]|nr:low molecular weight phosphatase family protein [Nanoarchaeota archaeon]